MYHYQGSPLLPPPPPPTPAARGVYGGVGPSPLASRTPPTRTSPAPDVASLQFGSSPAERLVSILAQQHHQQQLQLLSPPPAMDDHQQLGASASPDSGSSSPPRRSGNGGRLISPLQRPDEQHVSPLVSRAAPTEELVSSQIEWARSAVKSGAVHCVKLDRVVHGVVDGALTPSRARRATDLRSPKPAQQRTYLY